MAKSDASSGQKPAAVTLCLDEVFDMSTAFYRYTSRIRANDPKRDQAPSNPTKNLYHYHRGGDARPKYKAATRATVFANSFNSSMKQRTPMRRHASVPVLPTPRERKESSKRGGGGEDEDKEDMEERGDKQFGVLDLPKAQFGNDAAAPHTSMSQFTVRSHVSAHYTAREKANYNKWIMSYTDKDAIAKMFKTKHLQEESARWHNIPVQAALSQRSGNGGSRRREGSTIERFEESLKHNNRQQTIGRRKAIATTRAPPRKSYGLAANDRTCRSLSRLERTRDHTQFKTPRLGRSNAKQLVSLGTQTESDDQQLSKTLVRSNGWVPDDERSPRLKLRGNIAPESHNDHQPWSRGDKIFSPSLNSSVAMAKHSRMAMDESTDATPQQRSDMQFSSSVFNCEVRPGVEPASTFQEDYDHVNDGIKLDLAEKLKLDGSYEVHRQRYSKKKHDLFELHEHIAADNLSGTKARGGGFAPRPKNKRP